MKTWDVIIIGGGTIGLSLSIVLRKHGASVLIVEREAPGREASYAAAGMLADTAIEGPSQLQALAAASAQMYPEFVHQLQDESGVNCDLRDEGTIVLQAEGDGGPRVSLADLEPALQCKGLSATYVKERSVDPRALVKASLMAARHRGVDVSSGTRVQKVIVEAGKADGVETDQSHYYAPAVVNCAGAWAGQVQPGLSVRPMKGQILSVVGMPRDALKHVVRAPEVYLVPRSDGRILIGATVEDAGYDKRTDTATIQRMHRMAIGLLPSMANGRILEAWAGLRPAAPDGLPILGATSIEGYFAATGHFRDGILLTPITAHLMAQCVLGQRPELDISDFSPKRFG